MTDFEAPSFSLGLDFDQFDSDPTTTQSDDFETLIVDDSEPDSPDPHPNPNHLLLRTGNRKQNISNALELVARVSTSCNSPKPRKLNASCRRRFQVIDSDSDTDDPSVSYLNANRGQFVLPHNLQNNKNSHVTIDLDENDTLPPAHRYFFHYDIRIQELVRSRLCHFSPLDDELSRRFEQCSQSKIDYMRQFSCGESSKQDVRNISGKNIPTRRNFARESKTDESSSSGWVNPKFSVDKVKTKGVAKRKVHGAHQSPGQWLTGSDGKKVYVGKNGQELTGRVAYMRYKKENGAGFKKSKRRFFTKKKK